MRHITCPLLGGCLKLVAESAEQGELYEIRNLWEWAAALPSDHGHTCLRGFLIIEEMLSLIEMRHREYKKEFDRSIVFRLSSRSWEGLTQMKIVLGDLLDEVNLNDADSILRGPSIDNFGDIVYAVRLNRMKTSTEVLLDHIKTFRPYLRNPKAPVHRLAAGISVLYGWQYPQEYIQKMLCLTKKLMHARL